MEWNEYFKMMIDWKKLPAYKAETRIDSLIGFYLRPIISEYLKEEIDGIIPELPIRLGTVKPELENTKYSERSYKVDFFAIGNKTQIIWSNLKLILNQEGRNKMNILKYLKNQEQNKL